MCVERFGRAPAQILHEWNSITHVVEFDGQPGRRPLTYEEVQALFDAADGLAEDKRTRGRKGVMTAMRDSALLKAFYAYGLRRQEMCGLDLADFRHNPKAPDYGRYGSVELHEADTVADAEVGHGSASARLAASGACR